MNTEKTPVETYAQKMLELLTAYGRNAINDDQLLTWLGGLRCFDEP